MIPVAMYVHELRTLSNAHKYSTKEAPRCKGIAAMAFSKLNAGLTCNHLFLYFHNQQMQGISPASADSGNTEGCRSEWCK